MCVSVCDCWAWAGCVREISHMSIYHLQRIKPWHGLKSCDLRNFTALVNLLYLVEIFIAIFVIFRSSSDSIKKKWSFQGIKLTLDRDLQMRGILCLYLSEGFGIIFQNKQEILKSFDSLTNRMRLRSKQFTESQTFTVSDTDYLGRSNCNLPRIWQRMKRHWLATMTQESCIPVCSVF